MQKIILRSLPVLLLMGALLLASLFPRTSPHPVIDIEYRDPASGQSLSMAFLLGGEPTRTECERRAALTAREALQNCPHCRIGHLACVDRLDAEQARWLSDAPLETPAARLARGVAIFTSSSADFALAACQASAVAAQRASIPFRCDAPGAARPPLSKPVPTWRQLAALFAVAGFMAWLVGWFIVRYEHLHAHFSHDHTHGGPQKYHTQPTPRIGGLAVMAGLIACHMLMQLSNGIPDAAAYGLLLIAALPAFLGGLAEDVTKRVGVAERLLLTMAAGALAAWLMGGVIQRTEIPFIDQALAWLPLAVLFTAFAVGGVANAINIIDGYNGLAGGVSLIAFLALAYAGHQVGDALIATAALAAAGALLGFLVWNWPRGKIFLGDGGAYLTGFLLAELSVLLVAGNPAISPWFPVALLAHPIIETLYSIYRRRKDRRSPGHPDNAHMHQLIHDKLLKPHSHGPRFSRNSRVAPYLWAAVGISAAVALIATESSGWAIVVSAIYGSGYILFYRRLKKR